MPQKRGNGINDDGDLLTGMFYGTLFSIVLVLIVISVIGWLKVIIRFWGHLY